MENTKYGRRREGRWTPIRAKAQDTRANPNSWKTHLVRKRWDIGLLWALNPRIMMMMNAYYNRNYIPRIPHKTHIDRPSCVSNLPTKVSCSAKILYDAAAVGLVVSPP